MAERVEAVRERIGEAARVSGRSRDDVTLVAVCKTVGRADVDAGYACGLRDFGENRVQDALQKFAEDVPPDLRLHMIGSLQTNKARAVVGRFALIHSLDRIELAEALQKRAAQAGVRQPVLIQVNVAREPQKHGCDVEAAPALIEQTLAHANLELRGFMTMAPLTATAEEARPVFAALRELRDDWRRQFPHATLDELSMGMTNDYPVAIEEGATLVRVGRAVFAERVDA